MCLFSRTFVTVAFIQEKHYEQEHEHGGEVEWRKEILGARLIESGFDANLARHIDYRRYRWKVHLLSKKYVFSTAKERADENIQIPFDRSACSEMVSVDGDTGREEVIGALTLYMDFINLFINLLQLFGIKKD